MNKKSLNRKEATKTIQTKLENGIERQIILNELSDLYYDKSTLAKLIASTPDPITKKKYQFLNKVLLLLLVLVIIIKIVVGIALLSSLSALLIPFAFLIPIITVLFALEVLKFSGYIYNILGLLAIASILKSLTNLSESNIWLVISDILISLIIAGLAFYIAHKVFPNYGLFGPKKDANGNFLLS